MISFDFVTTDIPCFLETIEFDKAVTEAESDGGWTVVVCLQCLLVIGQSASVILLVKGDAGLTQE